MERKIIVIVGPTASGKTGIGVKLAKEFDGEIVSADSRQVFRRLDIGTGKEGKSIVSLLNCSIVKQQLSNRTIEQLRSNLRYIDGIPQWMIDVADPESKLTLFDYLPLARQAIDDILDRGKLPIVVGGTGLYVQGLVEGFQLESRIKNYESPTPPSLPSGRGGIRTREQLNNKTIEQLNHVLAEIDPEKYETIDRKNRHRLIRAIELAQEGLKPTKVKPDFEVLQIGVDLSRAELFSRIDRRVDERFNAGMLEEVQSLLGQGISSDWLLSLGLEYKIITEFLLQMAQLLHCSIVDLPPKSNGAMEQWNNEFELMSQQLKFHIHQFARRQLTWLRRFPEVNWLNDYKEMERFGRIFMEH